MGQFFSDILKDSSEEVKEELEILQEMARSIMEAQSDKMAARAFEDKTLPIVAIVDTKKCCYMSANSGVGDQVNEAVNSLFDAKFMDGFKKAVTVALNTFLGNAEAGRQESTEFHVVYDKNALLRIDLFFYLYEFSSEALKQHGQNLFCYVAQIAVLDSLTIDPTVTLYEMTKSIGKVTDGIREEFCSAYEFVRMFLDSLKRIRGETMITEQNGTEFTSYDTVMQNLMELTIALHNRPKLPFKEEIDSDSMEEEFLEDSLLFEI